MKRKIPQFFRLCMLFIAVVAGTSSAFGWVAVQTTIDGITYEATSSAGSTVIAVDPSLEDVTIPTSYKYVYYGKTYSSTVIALDFNSETLKKLSVSSSVNNIESYLSGHKSPNLTDLEVRDTHVWRKENENWLKLSCDLKTLIGGIFNTSSYQIPEGVEIIGDSAFAGCSGLTEVTIPNSVTSIGDSAFAGCSGLTEVTIPNSVTSIGDSAFKGCSGLTEVTIPNLVTSIGDSVFSGCSSLTEVRIPELVTSIGDYAFFGCSGLTEVTIPNSVTSIGASAFKGCNELKKVNFNAEKCTKCGSSNSLAFPSSITELNIGEKVKYIPDDAFAGFRGLTEVTIPYSVTYIGHYAFYVCSGLTEVTIPNSVTSIGGNAFYGCSGLTSVTIGNSVRSIGTNAFYSCSSLTEVTIGNSVTSIGENAFKGCSGLREVIIGNSITSIGGNAFYGCTGLKKSAYPNTISNPFSSGIRVSYQPEGAIIEDKVIYGSDKSSILYAAITLSGEFVIPESVTSIGSYAFYSCSGLTEVTIPESVTSIGNEAFRGCSGLTEVTIPESVTSIGNSVFSGCSGLTEVTIPESVTSIGDSAFKSCSSLSEVTIPESVTSIGSGAFHGCGELKRVNFNAENCTTYGDVYSPVFPSSVTELKIGDKVQNIPNYAFNGSDLTSVTIPHSVTSISQSAFSLCYKLKRVNFNAENCTTCGTSSSPAFPSSITELNIGDNVKNIPNYAFCGCSGLSEVIIPNSVTSIGSNAFSGCSGLTEVIIPESVTSIGYSAFYGCNKLKKVNFNAENCTTCGNFSYPAFPSSLTELNIGDKVKNIPKYAFYGCSGLTEVTIPESVTSIGNDAFWGCNELKKVNFNAENCTTCGAYSSWAFPSSITELNIGEKVKYIPANAFYGCSGLTEVTIPNSVTYIGVYAFYGCSGLTSVIIPASVTSIGSDAFYNCSGLKKSAYPNTLSKPFSDGLSLSYTPEGAVIEDGWIYGPEKSAILFAPYTLTGDYTIPASVTSIGNEAFRGCSGLKNLYSLAEIPAKINDNSFSGLYDTVKLDVPAEAVADYLATNWSLFKNLYQSGSEDAIVTYNDGLLNYRLIPASNDTEKNKAIVVSGKYSGAITVPERFTYTDSNNTPQRYYVEGIGYGAFQNSTLNTLSFNSRIDLKSIGDYAFAGSSISSIEIPSTVTSIGSSAFSNCSGLSSVTLNEKLQQIGSSAFSGCSKLSSIKIPSTVTSIGSSAFSNCSGLSSVTLNEGLQQVASSAFSGCSKLSSIKIPSTVTSIGSSAFYNCRSLSSVTLNDGLQLIESSTFSGCSKLSSIEIPSTVKTIGEKAFYNCLIIESISLSENLETIGVSAFSMDNENDIRISLTIPVFLKSIGNNAFLNRNLSKVVIKDLQAWCDIDFENKDSNPAAWTSEGLWLNDEKIINLVIPDGVKEIKPFTFLISPVKCYDFEEPHNTIQSGIKGQLKSVTIPNSVKSIGEGAFGYNGFTEITIPASVDYIGRNAFTGGNIDYSYKYDSETDNYYVSDQTIDPLKKITLEDSQNPIAIDANALTTSVSNPTKTLWNAPASFYLGRPLGSLPNGLSNSLQDLQLGNAMTEIPECGFSDCPNLTNVTVGNSIVEIPNNAFSKKSKLKSLTLGNSLTAIGKNAFSGCTALTEVVVPPSVETIGASAFAGNTAMANIIMGHKVKTIGEKAFDGCPAKTVSITAPNPPTAPNNTFSNYTGKLYLQGQEALDAYYDAFTCWDRFDSYVMVEPTELKYTGENKLVGNPGDTFQLNATLMPENVTLPQVFWRSTNPAIATVDANGLVTLHADLNEVKTLAEVDDEESGSTCKIIAESLYANGPVLEVTVNDVPTGIEEIIGDSEADSEIDFNAPLEVYTLNGLRIATSVDNLAPGFYIVRQGKAAQKIAVK